MELPSIVVAGDAAPAPASDCSSPLSSPPSSSLFIDFIDDVCPRSPSPVHFSPPRASSCYDDLRSSPPISHTTVEPEAPAAPEASKLVTGPSTPIRSRKFIDLTNNETTPPSPSRTGQPRADDQKEDELNGGVTFTPQATITRSGRRVAQKRLAPIAMGTKPIKASPSETMAIKRRKREAAKWQTDFVLSSAKSPLGNHDVRALLCNPEAWEVLSKEEQKEVLSLFPSNQHIIDPDSDQARPDIASLRNDDNFRHDCARYQTDLQGGFHDKAWLAEAFVAYEMRRNGHFDKYIIDAFESDWNIQLPDEYKPDYMRVTVGSDVEAEQSNDTGLLGEIDSTKTDDVKGNGANGEMKDTQSDTTKNGAVKVETRIDENEKDDTGESYVNSEFVVKVLLPDMAARESGNAAAEPNGLC